MNVKHTPKGATITLDAAEANDLRDVLWSYNKFVPHHRLTPQGVRVAVTLESQLARPEDLASAGGAAQ